MVPLDKLAQITQRFEFIEAQMSAGTGDIAALGREYADLRPVVAEIAGRRVFVVIDNERSGHCGRIPRSEPLLDVALSPCRSGEERASQQCNPHR